MATYALNIADTFGSEVISHYATLAGDTFGWEATKGGHEQSSKFKRLMREDMAARQGYVCPACGVEFTDEDMATLRVEANHVVAQGINKRGWFPGNVFVGHKECNARTAPVFEDGTLKGGKAILDMSDIARPDLIALEWTPLPILKRKAGYLK